MSLTKVQIINLALYQLGHEGVSSLIDGDALVVAAESAFDMKLPSVLSQGNWRFAIQISQLSKLAEVPPHPWKVVYSLPAGWLKTIRLYPNTYDWDIYNNEKIYAIQDGEWFMEYVYLPDVSHLPAHFVDYFVYEIAAFLALSNAQNTGYFGALESKRVQMQALAHAIETQNRPQFSQVDFPALNQRYIGGFIANTVG